MTWCLCLALCLAQWFLVKIRGPLLFPKFQYSYSLWILKDYSDKTVTAAWNAAHEEHYKNFWFRNVAWEHRYFSLKESNITFCQLFYLKQSFKSNEQEMQNFKFIDIFSSVTVISHCCWKQCIFSNSMILAKSLFLKFALRRNYQSFIWHSTINWWSILQHSSSFWRPSHVAIRHFSGELRRNERGIRSWGNWQRGWGEKVQHGKKKGNVEVKMCKNGS